MKLLHDVLDAAAPGQPAIRHGGVTWTYGELRDRSLGLASWLATLGAGWGDRVVVQAANHPQSAALLYATSRLGAAFTHLHPAAQPYQLRHVLADCDPALVIADQECLATARASAAVDVYGLDELPADSTPGRTLAGEPARPSDPACLIYTSGSTAMPKAVVAPHAQMLFAARAIQERLRYRQDDAVFCALPLSFDYGLYQILLCGLAGSELVLSGAGEAGPALLATLVRERISVAPLVPAMAGSLVRLLDRARAGDQLRPGTRLRLVTTTGASMSASTLRSLRVGLPGLRAQVMFGLTECKRVSIMEPDGDLARAGSYGRPLDGTDAWAVDADGRRLPPGETGELVVSGPHVMAGYWRAPALTESRFRVGRDGTRYLRTGDMCSFDSDGYLYFAGRIDETYKSRGLRVSAAEVEAAALDVPGVTAAAVVPPSDGQPAALLAVTGDVASPHVLKELTTRLEDFKMPAACHVLTAMPLTAHGKTDKKAVAARLQEASR
jgi:acyl-CoA synthetase (AMP-forming)/AMP-acid ligase II